MTFAGSEVLARTCSTGLVTMGFPLNVLIYCIVFTRRQASESRHEHATRRSGHVRNDVVSGANQRLTVPLARAHVHRNTGVAQPLVAAARHLFSPPTTPG